MNKKTSVILKSIFGIIVLGILSIGIKYALDQRKIGQEEFEESERILGRAKTEASEWDAEFDKLEDKKSLIEAFLDLSGLAPTPAEVALAQLERQLQCIQSYPKIPLRARHSC